MKKMKNKFIVFIFLLLFTVSGYGVEEDDKVNLATRFLNDISIYPSDGSEIFSGEEQNYILHVKDDLGNNLNGSYSLELVNNHLNQKINIIPRENFYYFKDGKVNISFELYQSGLNEIIVNIDNGRGKSKEEITVKPSKEPYSAELESVLPLKKGENRIRIYLKDFSGNDITEGPFDIKVKSEISNFDGRIEEVYYLQGKQIYGKEPLNITVEIVKEKEYIEIPFLIPEKIDNKDGIALTFYLSNGREISQKLSFYAQEEAEYSNYNDVGMKNKLVLKIDSNQAEMNNFIFFIDTKPLLINNKTMVPLRVVSDFLGIKAEWIAEKNGVMLTGKGKNLFLEIGSKNLQQGLDVPPVIISGRTYVPLRYVGENFNSLVIWDNIERKVTIIN